MDNGFSTKKKKQKQLFPTSFAFFVLQSFYQQLIDSKLDSTTRWNIFRYNSEIKL